MSEALVFLNELLDKAVSFDVSLLRATSKFGVDSQALTEEFDDQFGGDSLDNEEV